MQRLQNVKADNILLNVFQTGEVEKLQSIIALNFVNHAGGERVGLDSLKKMITGFHARMGTVKVDIRRQLADSEYVADWVRFVGSDSSMVVEGIELTKYKDGKAIEHWFFPGGLQGRRSK